MAVTYEKTFEIEIINELSASVGHSFCTKFFPPGSANT